MKFEISRLWLKSLMLSLTLVFSLPTFSQLEPTASVTLAWDANDPGDNIKNYTVHWGTSPKTYTHSLNVTSTTAKISGLSKALTYYFAVTATNATSTSDYSNEVFSKYEAPVKVAPYSIPGSSLKVGPDGKVEFEVVGIENGYCVVETSYDLVNWQYLTELSFDMQKTIKIIQEAPTNKKVIQKQFFRIKWEDDP